MDFGTYIIAIDKSQSVWGQPWHEIIPIILSQSGLNVLSPNKKSYYCFCSKDFSDCIEIGKDGEYIKQRLSQLFNNGVPERMHLIKSEIECGDRFNHIYRPVNISSFRNIYDFNPLQDVPKEYYKDPPLENVSEYSNYVRQLELILDELFDIFKVVSPHSRNMRVFGNAIRNVLILSCTEVDSLMKSVLNGNGYKVDRPNMNDYRQLIIPMKLFDYTLSFRYINEVGGKTPFGKWGTKENSNSLSWYKAYNHIKHDRINNFKKANLRNAIEATMGFATMLIATYGYRNDIWNEKIGRIIEVKKEPSWSLKDFYLPPVIGSEELYVNHPDICKGKTNKKS